MAASVTDQIAVRATVRPIAQMRVFMLDLLAIVPYYTGHLCAAAERTGGMRMTLASVSYSYDRQFFSRLGIRNDPGLLDVVSRLRRLPVAIRRMLKLLEYAVNMAVLLSRFAVSRPDVVHVQFLPLASRGVPVELVFLRLLHALGIKIVYTAHNVLPQDSGHRHAGTYRRIYQLADSLICHDTAAAMRLEKEFGAPRERISIIPHGPLFEAPSIGSAADARARLGFAADDCIVLWQGILRPYKGVSFLLNAWRQVCAGNARARLAIVGTGDSAEIRAIQQEAAALDMGSRVRLDLRFVSVQELADYYTAADVLVYPYSEVTTSGALMTGIVRGKAIVATSLPAFEDILQHGESALLVRYGDIPALAASLLRLIEDADLRRRLGEHLRVSAAQIVRWPDIARQTRDCYYAVLSRTEPLERAAAASGR